MYIKSHRWLTYPDGLIDGFVAVAVSVLIVRISALLARECVSALATSSHCCSAE